MRRELLTVAIAVCMIGGSVAKDLVVIVPAHPDDLIATIGFCLLAKDTFDIHVVDYTHGERGLGLEAFTNGTAKAIRTKEEEFEIVSESVACLHGGFLEAMFMPARIRDGVLFVPLRWFAEVIFRRFVTECDGALYFSGHYGEMSKDMAYLIKEILA